MITLKTEKEISIMKEGGKRLAWILKEIIKKVKPGVTTAFLDKQADLLIKKTDSRPSFKMVEGYKWATCLCPNDVVVHGVPGNYVLKEGDILGIDVGVFHKNFHTDCATTVLVGKGDELLRKFLETGRLALARSIEQAKIGNRIGHISQAIEKTLKNENFTPVKTLVGHGVGKKLHESPQIPCFVKQPIEKTTKIVKGITLAIEVIYNQGSDGIYLDNDDGWTIRTIDGKLSGLFEHTIAVTDSGPIVLTKDDQFSKITSNVIK